MIDAYLKAVLAGILAGIAILGSTVLFAFILGSLLPFDYRELGLGFLITFLLLATLLFLFSGGALALQLSKKHLSDIRGCLLRSEVAGICGTLTAVVLLLLLLSGGEHATVSFTDRLTGVFTNPLAIAGMFLISLISISGGLVYRELKRQKPGSASQQ